MKTFFHICLIVIISAVFFFGASLVGAAGKNWTNISTPELKKMMDSGEKIYLICVLPRIIYDEKHIDGSISIPIGKIQTSPDMPENKDRPIIFYCLGPA